ncbi:MAG TPA: hypothetical protein VFP64_11380, partial [Pyrinomonadaceae bacterium]|nr:hypothetical protein [Pyrinomonadaceae bacterium]
MKSRFLILVAFCALIFGLPATGLAQRPGGQTELSTTQRLDVMSSKLDLMRRSLQAAISALEGKTEDKSKDKKNADDPVTRLKGLEKEVSSLTSEVNDIRAKNDRAEKFDTTALDRLETAVVELNTKVETTLQQTAGLRNAAAGATASSTKKKKKKGKLFGLFGGGEDKYADLTG